MYEVAAWQPEIKYFLPFEQDLKTKPFWEIEFDDTSTIDHSNPKLSIYFRDNPFTQTELLCTQDDQVQALIHQIRKSKVISNHESLANKLLTLFNIAKEENPTSLGIAVDSLSNFYDFLQLYTNIKNPTLSLSPDYNIYASWRSKEQLFSAHFLQNGEIRFVLFKPNNRHPKHKIRITGTVTSDTLTEITTPESLNYWVFDERR
jgi:hypothetical protein